MSQPKPQTTMATHHGAFQAGVILGVLVGFIIGCVVGILA